MSKKWSFIISAVACLGALCALQPLTLADNWWPYVYWYNVATVASWSVVLYFVLRNQWNVKKCIICIAGGFVFACPQALFCVLVYSAWFCTAFSALLLVFLGIKTYKLIKQKRGKNERM